MAPTLHRANFPWRTTLGQAIIAAGETETVHLREAAAAIWLALDSPISQGELVKACQMIDPNLASDDVEAALSELSDVGLVVTS